MTAIVSNCGPNSLSIIQELGRRGVDVYALDSFRNVGTVSRFSNYRSCPSAAASEDKFVTFLLSISGEFDAEPVLIPTSDHCAAAIAHNREALSNSYRPCVPSGETVDLLLDKDAFGKWAHERGYPVPRSWSGAEIHDIPDSSYPIAAKPKDATSVQSTMFYSKIALLQNKLYGWDVELDREERERATSLSETRLEVLNSPAEGARFAAQHEDLLTDFVFQEYVRGMSDSMYTVGIYSNQGEVKGVFTGRKVRGYPPDVGDCKVGQAQSLPDRLQSISTEMCEALDYTGIAEFEFKRDTQTGEFHLIEVNPRCWSWIGITPAAGVNLPWMAYTDLASENAVERTESTVPDGSVTWVKAFEDLVNCLYFYRHSHPEWAEGPIGWWRSVRSDRTVVAELTRDDPVPTAYFIALLMRRLFGHGKQRLTLPR